MKAKWLNGFNEETQQNEQFYPITHKDAVIGLEDLEIDGDFVTSEAFEGDQEEEPGLPPLVANKIAEMEARIEDIENSIEGYVARLAKL